MSFFRFRSASSRTTINSIIFSSPVLLLLFLFLLFYDFACQLRFCLRFHAHTFKCTAIAHSQVGGTTRGHYSKSGGQGVLVLTNWSSGGRFRSRLNSCGTVFQFGLHRSSSCLRLFLPLNFSPGQGSPNDTLGCCCFSHEREEMSNLESAMNGGLYI